MKELIGEPLKIYKACKNRDEYDARIAEIMETVGLDERYAESFSHELDGGRRQRIGIGRALAMDPEFIICDIDQHLEPYYIDVAESFGLAADVCSRCSAETGVAIDDDFPIVGKAVLTTNMPCNASEATSMFQRRRFGLPDFPVTMAMIHNEPGAHPYSTQMLKDAIAFVEKEYGIKYDWDELFK